MSDQDIQVKLAQLEEPLNIDELTTGTVGGDGVFDVLITSVKAHLKEEFDKQRITGKEYAQVYLTTMNATLAQAIEYLQKSKTVGYEITNLEMQGEVLAKDNQLKAIHLQQEDIRTALLEAEVASAEALLKRIPIELDTLEERKKEAGSQAALAAVAAKAAQDNLSKIPLEIEILRKQSEISDSEMQLRAAQVVKIVEENKMIPHQIAKIQADVASAIRQNDLLQKELAIKESQLELQTKQLSLADAELNIRLQELDVKRAEVRAAEAQALLYAAKVKTEEAQTAPTALEGSVLGANIEVLKAQADGYKRDAEQKAAKILVDTWNVRRNTDEGTDANSINKLDDATIGRAIAKLLVGAGM